MSARLGFAIFATVSIVFLGGIAGGIHIAEYERAPVVIDGDTIELGGERIRLLRLDTPEMPGHCRPGRRCTPGDPYVAAERLQRLLDQGEIACFGNRRDRYGRRLARCTITTPTRRFDLADAMIEADPSYEWRPR